MSSTILRGLGRLRPVAALAFFAVSLLAGTARAHEIPTRVTVVAFVKVDSGAAGARLRVLVRVPLEAMRDVDFPQRGLGYLDLVRSAPLARDAAQLWIANAIRVLENGEDLPSGAIVATRISLPSDRAFAGYESALTTVLGAPLDPATDVPWQQASLDVLLEYPIASASSDFSIAPGLAGLGIQTTTVLRFIAADGTERAYQYVGDPGLVRLDPRWHHAAWQFVKLGVHHILGGIDHLLFVLCLVIPLRRFRPLLLVVTAFTIGHSITLISAAMGIVPDALWFPPLIETLIAASIVYMALENALFATRRGAADGTRAEPRSRWLLAFGFGLVHGFGFSFALAESLQFAGGHLLVSLLTFNLGVEIGQVLVLAAAIPALALLFRRVMPERFGVMVLSALIAHTAWHWMVDRGSTLPEYAFTWPVLDIAFAASALRAAMVLSIAVGAGWVLLELSRRLAPAQRPDPEAPSPS